MTIETRKLWRASASGLWRLARFLRVPTPPDGCDCSTCRGRLVEHVSRGLIA